MDEAAYKHALALQERLGVGPDIQRKLIKRHQVRLRIRQEQMKSERLPLAGEYLLHLFLPKKDREVLVGDLAEEYHQELAKFGQHPANLWFYKQVLTSLWPLLQTTGRTLTKWGLIGLLEEIIRRIAH